MRWIPLTLCLVALAGSAAARVAGGGPAATDCFAELDGPGISAVKGTRVECTDGDPACDRDDSCDGTCEFLVRVCVSQCSTQKTVDRVNVKGKTHELMQTEIDPHIEAMAVVLMQRTA